MVLTVECSFRKSMLYLKKLDIIKRILVADVIKLVKLILVMPATNAASERSFSFLKINKTIFAQQQRIIG